MKKLFLFILTWGIIYTRIFSIDYVVISEVLFDTPIQENDIYDDSYNFGEFVEIYNAGEDSVSLSNWKLEVKNPEQTFALPDIKLGPKSFFVIMFSDYNREDDSYDNLRYHFISPDTINIIFQEEFILPNDSCNLVLKDRYNITRDSIFITDNLINWPPKDCGGGNNCDFRSLQRNSITFNFDGTTSYHHSSWYMPENNSNPNAPDPVTVGYSYSTISTNILPISTTQTNNYIIEITPLIETNDITSWNLENSTNDALVSITYYDVLGREKQKTQLNYTPDNKHLTTFTEYDAFNRITKQWLPTITEKGQFTSDNFINNANSFYSNNNPYKEFLYSNNIFSETETYNNSLVGIQEPGSDLNGKYKKFSRRANNANEVKYFSVNSSNSLICNGYYDAKTLIYEEIKDDTYRVYDYHRKDKFGNERELHVQKAIDVINYLPVNSEVPNYFKSNKKETEDIIEYVIRVDKNLPNR